MVRVAIVGGGIAGCGLANFLKEDLGADTEIEIFEKDNRLGGRLRRVRFAGCRVDIGGTAINSHNRYALELAKQCSVSGGGANPTAKSAPSGAGIWNGTKWVCEAKLDSLWGGCQSVSKHPWSLLRSKALVERFVHRLKRVYSYQDKGKTFLSANEMLDKLKLRSLTQISAEDHFKKKWVTDSCMDRILVPTSRCNYGQGKEVNAFTMMVSLAGSGFSGWSFPLQQGTAALCRRTIARLMVPTHLNTEIKVIRKAESFFLESDTDTFGPFSHLVWAAPMPSLFPQLEGDLDPIDPSFTKEFQTTHVTLVEGQLNATYFQEAEDSELPEQILTTEEDNLPFSLISYVANSKDNPNYNVYRIFSRTVLQNDTLDTLFGERNVVSRFSWQAYPVQQVTESLPDFQLGPNFFYIGALEPAASCIEIQLIAAKNVSNLIKESVDPELE